MKNDIMIAIAWNWKYRIVKYYVSEHNCHAYILQKKVLIWWTNKQYTTNYEECTNWIAEYSMRNVPQNS